MGNLSHKTLLCNKKIKPFLSGEDCRLKLHTRSTHIISSLGAGLRFKMWPVDISLIPNVFLLQQGEKGDPGLMGLPGARGPIGPRV